MTVKSPINACSGRFALPSSFQNFNFQHFSFTLSPHFPSIRSSLSADSGGYRQKQIPSSGHDFPMRVALIFSGIEEHVDAYQGYRAMF